MLARAVGLNVAGQAGGFAIAFFSSILLARMLGPTTAACSRSWPSLDRRPGPLRAGLQVAMQYYAGRATPRSAPCSGTRSPTASCSPPSSCRSTCCCTPDRRRVRARARRARVVLSAVLIPLTSSTTRPPASCAGASSSAVERAPDRLPRHDPRLRRPAGRRARARRRGRLPLAGRGSLVVVARLGRAPAPPHGPGPGSTSACSGRPFATAPSAGRLVLPVPQLPARRPHSHALRAAVARRALRRRAERWPSSARTSGSPSRSACCRSAAGAKEGRPGDDERRRAATTRWSPARCSW